MENTRKTLKTYSYNELSSSAHLIGSNEDLLTEILVRLPATSILRFKCLSKDCHSLLTHPSFTLRNDKLSISPGLFIRNKYVSFDNEYRTPPPFRSLDFYPDVNGIRILQSCNGLLLCCSRQGHVRDRMYYVFNPTTKQFAINLLVYSCDTDRFVGLAYHQTSCPHYKVFSITFSYPDPTRDVILVEIQIYSSDARKWKNLNHYFSESSYNTPFGNGVYWNEAVYWHPSDLNILSYFDLNLEKLKELPIPSPKPPMKRYGYRSTYLYFGESRGHLHWVGTAKYKSRIYLLVYEMSRDHSWFVKYKVEVRDLPDVCPQMIRNNQFEVIDIVRGEEEEEDVFMVFKVKKKMVRYNIMDKSCKHMTTVNNLIRIGRGEVHRYIQALTSF